MKKLLLASMLGAALTCSAADTVGFSYADDCDDFWGTSKKETYDVAIFLPGEQFKDFNIVSVQVPLNVMKGGNAFYLNPTVWLTTELKLESKKNVVDVASYEATIDEDGILSFQLPESYTITDKGIYVGYSFEIKTLSQDTKYPVAIGYPSDENGFFIHSSRSYVKWTNISKGASYSSAISVGLENENMAGESVSFYSLPDPIYVEKGKEATVNAILSTAGSNPVESVDFEYTVGGKVNTYHCDLPEAVPAAIGKKFNASFVIPAQDSKSTETVDFTITKVNGVDNRSAQNKKTSVINVLNYVPVHQALFEEYTGTWCGFCVRGYAALEYIKKNYPDFVVAAYHNGDAMTITSNYPNSPSSGLPAAFLDRSGSQLDPYFGSQAYKTILPIVDDILAINSTMAHWSVKVSHEWESETLLNATAEVSCIDNVENGKYKIGYILVADGLSGTASSWEQHNYYSSYKQDDSVIPELNNFCKDGIYGTSSVKGLVFDDVVISTTGIKGVSGSIPANLEAEEVVSHSIQFDVTKIPAELRPDINKLRVIAVVLDSKGQALNCAKDEVNDHPTGSIGDEPSVSVEGIDASDNAPVEFFNINGVKVANPSDGIFIRRQGSNVSKVVVK